MGFARFYGHFAAACGTFWLVLLLMAVMSQSHIDAGGFGLLGIALLALLYAFIRMAAEGRPNASRDDVASLRERVAFLEGALEGERGRAGEHDA